MPIQQALEAGVFQWDNAQQTFVASTANASVVADTGSSTLTLSVQLSGPLAALTGQSPIHIFSYATYTPQGMSPTFALDGAGPVTANSSLSVAAHAVQQCASPCSQGASWVSMINLTGVDASTTDPLPAFGANTISIEFDVANLPAAIDVCRYPSVINYAPAFVDSQWGALLDIDANPNTGQDGVDALVFVHTPEQQPNCVPSAVATSQALSAELDQWNAAQANFVSVGSVPVTADTTNGKIVVSSIGPQPCWVACPPPADSMSSPPESMTPATRTTSTPMTDSDRSGSAAVPLPRQAMCRTTPDPARRA